MEYINFNNNQLNINTSKEDLYENYSYNISKRKVSNIIIRKENISRSFNIKNIPDIDHHNNYFETERYLTHLITKCCEEYNNNKSLNESIKNIILPYHKYKIAGNIVAFINGSELNNIDILETHYAKYKKFRILLDLISKYENFYNYPLDIIIMDNYIYILYNFYIILKVRYNELYF